VLLWALSEASERVFSGLLDGAVQKRLNVLILPDGVIKEYSFEDFNLDQINMGKLLLRMKRIEGRYEKALHTLVAQLGSQPRTASGSYWHKKIYPNQVWLDGLYMFGPFQACYGASFNRIDMIDDVCRQFLAVRDTLKQQGSGLYFHARMRVEQQSGQIQ